MFKFGFIIFPSPAFPFANLEEGETGEGKKLNSF